MEPLKNYASSLGMEDYLSQYEYPRAGAEGMLFCRGRTEESLGGKWHYAIDQYDTFLRNRWFEERPADPAGRALPLDHSFDTWPEMTLPCCWNTFKETLFHYEGSMIFTRTFPFEKKDGERVFLRIGAANYLCRVFLNGRYLGMHRGGSTPFFFELTGLLEKENRIILQSDSTRRPEQVPAENTDWYNYGGVYRGIGLIRVPEVFIRDFRIALEPDGRFRHLRVRAVLSVPCAAEAVLTIPELGIRETIPVQRGLGEALIEASPRLWSPEDPKLYRVTLTCGQDSVSDEAGFREIRVRGQDILLNGRPVFLRGVCVHEDSVRNGKALTTEEMLENIRLAKELGCNFMRLTHYPHSEEMAYLADREGILLWEEIPVYWAVRFGKGVTLADARNQLRELIRRDGNRASVIIWSVGNENADTDKRLRFMRSLVRTARHEDGTRLVSAACLIDFERLAIADRLMEDLDVVGINEYMGWYMPDFSLLGALFANSRPEKPVIISEFGADALAGLHGSPEDKGTEECQAEIFRKQIETIRGIPYVKGMTPWILYDFRSPRRTSSLQNYYNRKGLLSPDKRVRKQAFAVLRDFYKETGGPSGED